MYIQCLAHSRYSISGTYCDYMEMMLNFSAVTITRGDTGKVHWKIIDGEERETEQMLPHPLLIRHREESSHGHLAGGQFSHQGWESGRSSTRIESSPPTMWQLSEGELTLRLTDVGPTWCVDPTGHTSCHYPPHPWLQRPSSPLSPPWPGLLCSHAFCFLSGEGEKHVGIISVHDTVIPTLSRKQAIIVFTSYFMLVSTYFNKGKEWTTNRNE